jgi:hypothetical protein
MKIPLSLFQEQYIPTIPDGQLYLTVTHSWKTLSIARSSAPDQVCGSARRVGYASSQPDALALYRLRVIYRYRSIMLPGLFVFQDGVFTLYGDAVDEGDENNELI